MAPVAGQEPERVTVNCQGEACQVLDCWNQLVPLAIREYELLGALQDSLVHDPPGRVVAVDRHAIVKELSEILAKKTRLIERMGKLDAK